MRSNARALVVLLLSSQTDAAAQQPFCTYQEAELVAPSPAYEDFMGWSVALFGDTAVVGAIRSDAGGLDSGAAYVYVRSGGTWIKQATLLPGDIAAGDNFGASVAIFGETAVVGSPLDGGTNTGSAYVFARNGTIWMQQAKLVAGDPAASAHFGKQVAISGDTVVVGAPWNFGLPMSGAAYVFQRTGTAWTQEAKIETSHGSGNDQFGGAVAVDGDLVAVGAPNAMHSGEDGAAYVFERVGTVWTERARLSDPSAARLGSSVAISGDILIVGDPGDGFSRAFVYARQGTDWVHEATLQPSEGTYLTRFGRSVAIDGDRALVGAIEGSGAVGGSGTAYMFERSGTTWSEVGELVADDGAVGDSFGVSAALHQGFAVVGAMWHSEGAWSGGAAYVYSLPWRSGAPYCTCPVGPCGNSDPDAGCANSTAAGASLEAEGSTFPDHVDLLVSGAPPGQFAIFFQGDNAVMLPFGAGFRCAGGGVLRITIPPVVVEPDGTAAYGPCYGDAPISAVTGVVPGGGAVRRYQFWYRDPSGPCGATFNLSNGYEIVW